MKILMVSMNAIHFERWTDQLKNSGHEVFWFNINGGAYSENLNWVRQINDWKYRFPNLRGRIFVKKYWPKLYKGLSFVFEKNLESVFEKTIKEIRPDVVHSFVLHKSCIPILDVMKKNPQIKWIYSSWGSDLYNKSGKPDYENNLKSVLCNIDYLFTDCKRDYQIALEYGFSGVFLGVFPGGGGFKYNSLKSYIKPLAERKIILIKGYQGALGRAINVLMALSLLQDYVKNLKIVVFGADLIVEKYILHDKNLSKLNIQVFSKKSNLRHDDVLKLMGKSLIYIGNSVSDGIPNTLLEAIVMGAFPMQSNPGGASAEVINNEKNGLIIPDCDNVDEIRELLLLALTSNGLIENAFKINQEEVRLNFEFTYIKNKTLSAYREIKL